MNLSWIVLGSLINRTKKFVNNLVAVFEFNSVNHELSGKIRESLRAISFICFLFPVEFCSFVVSFHRELGNCDIIIKFSNFIGFVKERKARDIRLWCTRSPWLRAL